GAVAAWIDRFTIMEDVRVSDHSDAFQLIVAQGAGAPALVALDALPPPQHVVRHAGGVWHRGLEAYGLRIEGLAPANLADGFVQQALSAGAQSASALWFEVERLRAGVPSPAHEFKDEVNPL